MSSADEFSPTSGTHEEPLHNLATMFETVPSHRPADEKDWIDEGCKATIVPVDNTEDGQLISEWITAPAWEFEDLEAMR